MNLLIKSLLTLSFFSIVFISLEAKTIEILMDRQTEKKILIKEEIPGLEFSSNEGPLIFYTQKLSVKNLGKKPIVNCFPYINSSPNFSLISLADQIQKWPNPLLALYNMWNHAVILDDIAPATDCHPLDLMNFIGRASRQESSRQFIRLCNALGIETRLANVKGKKLYDFSIDGEWQLLDLNEGIFYQALEGEKLTSSEEIMDDPFLALRTKHSRSDHQFDFTKSWEKLAAFDILNPSSCQLVHQLVEPMTKRPNGYTLYPGDSLVFEIAKLKENLKIAECTIRHLLHLESLDTTHRLTYNSPIPLRKLHNLSDGNIKLIDQKRILGPGDSIVFDDFLYEIKISFDSKPNGKLVFSGTGSWTLFPTLAKGENRLRLGVEKNPSKIKFKYIVDEKLEGTVSEAPRLGNQDNLFQFAPPSFILESQAKIDEIRWQISMDNQFQTIPSNFDLIEPFTPIVTLSSIDETFLSPDRTYYFRVKGCQDGKWSSWSSPFSFSVQKPASAEAIEFEQVGDNEYELNWERYAEKNGEPIEYLVFGSNSIDFIPSIYTDFQVNSIVENAVDGEVNDNLIGIASEPKFKVKGSLAYYRVISRQHGALSVPSLLVRVYDHDLIQPRNALQLVKENCHWIAKRMPFSPAYPWTETSLPRLLSSTKYNDRRIPLQSLMRSMQALKPSKIRYEYPEVSEDVWNEVRPYLLPENHPAWAKVSRIFCKTRAIQNPDYFRKAGFRRYRPGRWSRVAASSHPECQEYFIKAYCDSEVGIIYDWKKWIHRIEGTETIRTCIRDYQLQDHFKVPHKWLYPLPKNPSPPNNSHYVRKNFILICENMQILEHSHNEKAYKHKMNAKLIKGLYTILQVCGLYDSVYVFNIPFCKDGRIAVIDTEYHHKWPVPFAKLNKAFSKSLQDYWKRITFKGGSIPNGVSRHNPPRMDRRDVHK